YKDVSNGVAPAGIEYYLPLFFEKTAAIFDYLPKAATVCLHGQVHDSLTEDRKSTRLNSSPRTISYAVFCLKKKNKETLSIIHYNYSVVHHSLIFFHCYSDHRHLHSFPTRRSSDLYKDVSNGVAPAGIEYYLPLFFEKTAAIFDYLPKAATVCLHGQVHDSLT